MAGCVKSDDNASSPTKLGQFSRKARPRRSIRGLTRSFQSEKISIRMVVIRVAHNYFPFNKNNRNRRPNVRMERKKPDEKYMKK